MYLVEIRTGVAHHIFEFGVLAQSSQHAVRIQYLVWSMHQSSAARQLGRKVATP
jgi:hypothetical protein